MFYFLVKRCKIEFKYIIYKYIKKIKYMILKYKQYNESIKSLLVGPTNDEIKENIRTRKLQLYKDI